MRNCILSNIVIKFLVSILCIFFLTCKPETSKKEFDNRINWMTIEEAQAKNVKNPRPFFIMVYANWCPKCARFDKETYKDPKVIESINSQFHPVKFNAHTAQEVIYNGKSFFNSDFDETIGLDGQNSYHELLFEISAKSIPSIVYVGSDYEILGSEMGFKEADELRSLNKLYGL